MLKSTSLVGFFKIVIIRLIIMRDIISGCPCFCLCCEWDSIKRYFTVFYYCNLSTYDQTVTTTAVGLQWALNTVFLVWCHHLQSKQIIGCILSDAFLKIVLFFYVPQYSNRFDYVSLKTDDEQFTLTTKNYCISPLTTAHAREFWIWYGVRNDFNVVE